MKKMKHFAAVLFFAAATLVLAACGKDDNNSQPAIDYSVTPTTLEGTSWTGSEEFYDDGHPEAVITIHFEFTNSSTGTYSYSMEYIDPTPEDENQSGSVPITYTYSILGEQGVGRMEGSTNDEAGYLEMTFTVNGSTMKLYDDEGHSVTIRRDGAPEPEPESLEGQTWEYNELYYNDEEIDPTGGISLTLQFTSATTGTYTRIDKDRDPMVITELIADSAIYDFAYTLIGAKGTAILLVNDVPHTCRFFINGDEITFTDLDGQDYTLTRKDN